MPLPNRALTLRSNFGLLRVLSTTITVFISGKPEFIEVNAIWDTGATGSVITKKVAQRLGLKETGFAKVHTAGGEKIQRTYTIDIGLPNRVVIRNILATEADELSGGCEALIGMDIITLGDFSITNHKGVTCMSFRIPSSHEIDYVKNPYYGSTPISKISSARLGTNFTPPKKKRRK